MELLKSELFYKLRNLIDPEFKKKDFSFYIHKIYKIAPLSSKLHGDEFFKKILPQYFQEVVLNEDNLLENILYLPLFLKKHQAKYDFKDYWLELIDYEFAKYQIETDPSLVKLSQYNENTTYVYLNPMAQAIRHEYDIHEYVLSLQKKLNKSQLPKHNKTLLLISKHPEKSEAIFKKGTIHHAALIDELHDGKIAKKDLLASLQNKYPNIAHSEWVIALKDLKAIFFVLET